MNFKRNSVIILFLLFIINFFQCRISSIYIPERQKSVSLTEYSKYRGKLLQAYNAKDEYTIAVQLANLKASNKLVFEHLKQAVNKDRACCNDIFEIQNIADQGFFQNIYKADTIRFKQVFGLCLQKIGKNAYLEYIKQDQEKIEIFNKSKPRIDSSLIKPELILILQKIQQDDQKYRRSLSDFRIKEPERKKLWTLQNNLDSLNLIRVDSILNTYGYPRPQEVGFDLSLTTFLVLHHQGNIEVRKKYLALIKDKLSEDQIKLFINRTESIKDNEKNQH